MISRRWLCSTLLGVALAVGCDDGGLNRHTLSGTVTFDSQPVPIGVIRFEADHSKGNTGPATIARIKDGKFRTPRSKGATPGALKVVVEGYDGSEPTEAYPLGQPLFEVYRTTIDVESAESGLLFEIPTDTDTDAKN